MPAHVTGSECRAPRSSTAGEPVVWTSSIPRSRGLPYSPGSLSTEAKAHRTAREFADLVGRVVNTTVSPYPVAFVPLERPEFEGIVGFCPHKVAEPMQLTNGRYLYAYQRVGLRRPERYLTTLEYAYTYQETEHEDSWIFRYEYQREPHAGYPYPLAHVHVNGSPAGYEGPKPFPDLHLPTGRVTIEAVVRHLIEEHDVPTNSSNWPTELQETEDAFREIQWRRLLDPPDPN